MPRRRIPSAEKYHISADKYQELYFFCRQYDERKKEINSLYSLSAVVMDGMPRGNSTGDQTANKAIRIDRLRRENELIEQTAREVDPCIYECLMKNVTEGLPYEYLNCFYCRNTFYTKRQQFFKLLSERR